MQDLIDRSADLFGRESHIQHLVDAAAQTGLTAVAGRPFMGKSWTLNEVARRLVEDDYVVGFAESFGEHPDLLLRAVKDLYERWLSDAGAREQAAMAWSQQKDKLLPNVAKAVSKIFDDIIGTAAKPLGAAVSAAFDGLITANQDLKSGRIMLKTLQYEDARDLLQAVSAVSARKIVLVLDQWEKSPDVEMESGILDGFLRHADDWPACRIVLGLRPDHPAFGVVTKLAVENPGRAEVFNLPEMDLSAAGEAERLLAWLHSRHPVASALERQELLDLIGGYPGVLDRWNGQNPQTAADLTRLADDAQNYRFRELDALLSDLDGDARRLAIRLTLVALGTDDAWTALRPQIMDGIDIGALGDLVAKRVLEGQDPPGFGHARRSEAAAASFREARPAEVAGEISKLALQLAGQIKGVEYAFIHQFTALSALDLQGLDTWLKDQFPAALKMAAASGLGSGPSGQGDIDLFMDGAKSVRLEANKAAAPLISIGLFNTLNNANGENDLGCRDALLRDLRDLAAAHADDAAVRERLAMGLFNTLNDVRDENDLGRRDALLRDLRDLAAAHADDAAVRERLAAGLFNTLNHAKDENDLGRRDALLQDLRDLAAAYPEGEKVMAALRRAEKFIETEG